MTELNDQLLDEALNNITNFESSKPKNVAPMKKSQDETLQDLYASLGENFADDILKNLSEIDVSETNELIENVLGELMSKDLLLEPFQCIKSKLESEIKKGDVSKEKPLQQISDILHLMEQETDSGLKNNEKLMKLIYDLQEQGEIWGTMLDE